MMSLPGLVKLPFFRQGGKPAPECRGREPDTIIIVALDLLDQETSQTLEHQSELPHRQAASLLVSRIPQPGPHPLLTGRMP
jgi:hypothetical protein